jgi:polyphosphate kinase
MIIRGIFCAVIENPKFKKSVTAISIVDEYLEHARVMIFNNGGKQKVFISSADWMVRNLDHRVEVAMQVTDKEISRELIDIIQIQLKDNVKARVLDYRLSNTYVSPDGEKKIRSQFETYNYLHNKTVIDEQAEEPKLTPTLVLKD